MEEPISFNLWGKIIPSRRKEAIDFIRQQSVFPSEIELRKAVMASIANDRAMQISVALGLSSIRTLEAAAGNIFDYFTLCQEGYGPAGKEAYCPIHNLHFGGCLGCHICSGFYRE
jgi:hypothetical protein